MEPHQDRRAIVALPIVGQPVPARAPRAAAGGQILQFDQLHEVAMDTHIAPYAPMAGDPAVNHVRPRHKPAMVARIAATPQGSGVYPSRRSGWFAVQ